MQIAQIFKPQQCRHSLLRGKQAFLFLAIIAGLPLISFSNSGNPTVDHAVQFKPGDARAKAVFGKFPALRDMVSEPFVMAGEDLDDDGRKEIILQAASSSYCGSAGCLVVVLAQRDNQIVQLFSANLDGTLVVTKEKIGSYKALALVDEQGRIIRANRPGTPMHGKLLVYPMNEPRR